MKKLLSATALLLGLVLLAGGFVGVPTAEGEEAAELDGQNLFTDVHKCNMCHAVPAAEIEAKTKSEKMKGAALGGKVEVEVAKLAAFLRKEGELDGEKHKKEFKGTDEELQAIIDWLATLEAPKDE